MPVHESELRRLVGDSLQTRTMAGNPYCASCGYCLKSLPHFGRCPECGSHYNAQSLQMTGIYLSQHLRPPIALALGTMFCLAIGLTLLAVAAADPAIWWIGFGVLFSGVGVVYLRSFVRDARRYLQSRSVERLIHRARQDDE